ncbi:hypothetical protein HY745_12550 [Candidatus Desantisbacteria bacterium]|nr:hypothetical protein [Candidatus Desantisbacteria bacterium]
MNIKFSRHAKRRAKLYDISESIIINILTNMNLSQGEHEIIKEVIGFKYPLKIVISVENDIITVITNYPLKKGIKK